MGACMARVKKKVQWSHSSFGSLCPFFVEFLWTELVSEQDSIVVNLITNLQKLALLKFGIGAQLLIH